MQPWRLGSRCQGLWLTPHFRFLGSDIEAPLDRELLLCPGRAHILGIYALTRNLGRPPIEAHWSDVSPCVRQRDE